MGGRDPCSSKDVSWSPPSSSYHRGWTWANFLANLCNLSQAELFSHLLECYNIIIFSSYFWTNDQEWGSSCFPASWHEVQWCWKAPQCRAEIRSAWRTYSHHCVYDSNVVIYTFSSQLSILHAPNVYLRAVFFLSQELWCCIRRRATLRATMRHSISVLHKLLVAQTKV